MVLLTVGAHICVQHAHTHAQTHGNMCHTNGSYKYKARGGQVEKVACQCSWHFAQQGPMEPVYLVALSDRSESIGILQDLLPATHLTGGPSENSAETLLYVTLLSTAVATT